MRRIILGTVLLMLLALLNAALWVAVEHLLSLHDAFSLWMSGVGGFLIGWKMPNILDSVERLLHGSTKAESR